MQSNKVLTILSQSLPPAVLALPLAGNPSGLWLSMPLSIFCSLVSIYSIVKTILGKKYCSSTLTRPLLVLFITLINFVVANSSYNFAEGELLREATTVQALCIQMKACPEHLQGWQETSYGSTKKFGNNYKYTAFYKSTNENKSFEIYLHQIPDRGVLAKGGLEGKQIKLLSIADETTYE